MNQVEKKKKKKNLQRVKLQPSKFCKVSTLYCPQQGKPAA